MGLNLTLVALTVPEGTEFPGQVQGNLNLNAMYLAIVGDDNFSGINYGPVTPDPDNRDRPWFKTDGSMNPIGWYGWDGSAWVPIPVTVASGATGDRPSSPTDGTLYLDTTIHCLLMYERAAWRTADGSPGDVKFVAGTVLADVLLQNPGWSQYADGIGKYLMGALADGSDAEDDVGANSISLTTDQLPAHAHTVQGNFGSGGEGGADNPLYYDAAQAPLVLKPWADTGTVGTGADIDIRPASKVLFSLIKD